MMGNNRRRRSQLLSPAWEGGEDLAPAFVASEIPRGGVEASRAKLLQERSHELRVVAGRAAYRVADADDVLCDAPSCERDFLHLLRLS